MKTISIDFEKILDPFSGLGQYCHHLKKAWMNNPSPDFNFKYFIPQNKFSKKINLFFPFFSMGADVFHAIHQDSNYRPHKNQKYVLTIHDLNFLYEKNRPDKNPLQNKIKRADHIVAISQFTKNEILKNFQVDEKKITVIYNGLAVIPEITPPAIQLNTNEKYLFSVGAVVLKKNFGVLVDFIKNVPDEIKIILAGNHHYKESKNLLLTIKNEKLENRFILTGTITDAEKNWYYQNACGFIYPSLLEGFGLPVVEAMHFKLPLYLSPRTAIPEIAGPEAFYFSDPTNGKLMAAEFLANQHFYTNNNKLDLLFKRSTQFNFNNTAHQYLEIYRNLF